MSTATIILNNTQIEQKLNRIAYQLLEDCHDDSELYLAGIVGNGYTLAARLEAILKQIAPFSITLAKVQLNKENPLGNEVTLSIAAEQLAQKTVVLVDDVLNSGKTMIYGLHPFLDIPLKKLRTAVLVDRNHKRYPISADFVGITLATTLQEHIDVNLSASASTADAAYLS